MSTSVLAVEAYSGGGLLIGVINNTLPGPLQAPSYWGGNIFQKRAPEAISFRKTSRLKYYITILDNKIQQNQEFFFHKKFVYIKEIKEV